MTKRMSKRNLPQFVMSGDGFNLFSDDRDWLEQHPWRKWGTIYVQEQAAGSGRVGGDAMNDTEETAADAARRFARENVQLTAQVAALTTERDGLLTDLIHFAQTNHQAHHSDHSGTWLSCDRGSCPGLRRAVSRARGATMPPAGAQEGE